MRSLLPAFVSIVLLGGCGSYTISGRVVRGEAEMVVFVPPDDPALEIGEGVAGADILVYRDPDQLNRELVARARSRDDGSFTLLIGDFGAGWMDEEWEIQSAAPGHQRAQGIMRLPSGGADQILLILLAEGVDPLDPRDESLLDEYERYN